VERGLLVGNDKGIKIKKFRRIVRLNEIKRDHGVERGGYDDAPRQWMWGIGD